MLEVLFRPLENNWVEITLLKNDNLLEKYHIDKKSLGSLGKFRPNMKSFNSQGIYKLEVDDIDGLLEKLDKNNAIMMLDLNGQNEMLTLINSSADSLDKMHSNRTENATACDHNLMERFKTLCSTAEKQPYIEEITSQCNEIKDFLQNNYAQSVNALFSTDTVDDFILELAIDTLKERFIKDGQGNELAHQVIRYFTYLMNKVHANPEYIQIAYELVSTLYDIRDKNGEINSENRHHWRNIANMSCNTGLKTRVAQLDIKVEQICATLDRQYGSEATVDEIKEAISDVMFRYFNVKLTDICSQLQTDEREDFLLHYMLYFVQDWTNNTDEAQSKYKVLLGYDDDEELNTDHVQAAMELAKKLLDDIHKDLADQKLYRSLRKTIDTQFFKNISLSNDVVDKLIGMMLNSMFNLTYTQNKSLESLSALVCQNYKNNLLEQLNETIKKIINKSSDYDSDTSYKLSSKMVRNILRQANTQNQPYAILSQFRQDKPKLKSKVSAYLASLNKQRR